MIGLYTGLIVLCVVSGVVALFLAFLVLKGVRHVAERLSFALFASCMGLWAIFVGLFLLTNNAVLAEWYVKAYYIAAVVLVYALLLFSAVFARHRQEAANKNLISGAVLGLMALPIVAVVLTIILPNGLIQSIGVAHSHVVHLDFGYYLLYTLTFVVYACLTIFNLIRVASQKRAVVLSQSVIWVICICLPLASLFNLFLPLLGIYSLIAVGPIFALPVAIVFFYAIIKQSLFDVRLAVVRSLTYSLIIVAMACIYFALAFLISNLFRSETFSTLQLFISLIIALLLAVTFQPIRAYFDRLTNHLLYRSAYTTDDFYERLNQKLSGSFDTRSLLEQASEEIGSTLRAEQCFVYVIYADSNRYVIAGTAQHSPMTIDDIDFLKKRTEHTLENTIVTEQLFESDPLRARLLRQKVAVIVPLILNEELFGYVFLGEHRSGNYTARDTRVLETVSDTLLIAIQNSLSVQEVKDLNATLQQRIDDATRELRASNEQLQRLDAAKDEFVSMASHQLRTPLTSVKGYIDMVLDGDVGKITDMQRKLLSEAFTSSERMVHLINDFLNVSRLQTGKFMVDRRQVDMAKLVAQEVSSLQTTAESRNLTLSYRPPSVFPVLYVDENKLRQVIMNFIDNAFFYSREHSTVTVTLKAVGGEAMLTVKDSGMGVPKSEQKNLFTKFFRATNARKQRPDGTGVGLFLAKKVIDAHGGSVIFESVEGKGSTFGFRLPVKKLSLPPADDADQLDN